MVIGIFLRHYKCYKGARFFPFLIDQPKNLKVFIGNNGAGKSSILEALDTFFNNREWTIHFEARKTEAYVAPLFLSEKSKLEGRLSRQSLKSLEIISDYFWSVLISSNANYKKYYEPFFDLRTKIEEYRDTHFLFALSKEYDSNMVTFNPFDKGIKDAIKAQGERPTPSVLNKVRDELLNFISYLYIPVETSLSEFLRLETRGMQELMNVDIKREIASSLNTKQIRKSDGNRTKNINLLDIINDNLEEFVGEIERTIQTIDKEYNFEKDFKSKVKLTSNHVTDVIIQAYFSKRRLKKAKKSIVNLSAGERKRALIDIAYTFLSQAGKQEKDIILAIDEPESSLHISQCYEQFSKIDLMASQFNKQVLITTHWYGSLPILKDGILHHIDNENDDPICNSFGLQNYFEDRGNHPNDIHLKSFFDLSSSILSSLRLYNTNWLLVEGNEDRKYLDYYLSDLNCKIIPLGGCTIVKTIYEYLYLPMSQKNESKEIGGKVFCLTDTDTNGIKLNTQSQTKEEKLKIRRLQFDNASSSIELRRINDEYKSATEIEESLVPEQFYVSLAIAIEMYGDKDQKEAFDNFEYDDSVKCSFIKGDYSLINHLGKGRNIRTDKNLISLFIDNHKNKIAEQYISFEKIETPGWVIKIREFFNN